MLKRITVLTLVALTVLCFVKYRLNSQVEAQAGQISHARLAGCTAPTTTDQCTSTGNWSSAFLDTNYTAICTAVNETGPGGTINGAVSWIVSKTSTQVKVGLQNDITCNTGCAQQHTAAEFDCIAIHD